jgi:hypothetical protein
VVIKDDFISCTPNHPQNEKEDFSMFITMLLIPSEIINILRGVGDTI